VNGRLVPTFFPAFQAARSQLASSDIELPMWVLLGLDWSRKKMPQGISAAGGPIPVGPVLGADDHIAAIDDFSDNFRPRHLGD
jgi:hypothetical protein